MVSTDVGGSGRGVQADDTQSGERALPASMDDAEESNEGIRRGGEPVVSIYALCCPVDRAIRYVGASSNIQGRLKGHLSKDDNNEGKRRWIAELAERGLTPKVEILEQVNESQASVAERKWISRLRSQGVSLFNIVLAGRPVQNRGGDIIRDFERKEALDKAAKRIGLSQSQLRRLCQSGRMPGAEKVFGVWIVPKGSWPEGRKRMGRPPTWE